MKTYTLLYDAPTAAINKTCDMGEAVCVAPHMVEHASGDIATFAGYPDGKHHMLVKAAEARLAVSQGAELIIAVLANTDEHYVMTECVTLREAVPHPTTLAVVIDTQVMDAESAVNLAQVLKKSGVDAICTGVTDCREELNPQLAAILPLVGLRGEQLTVRLA